MHELTIYQGHGQNQQMHANHDDLLMHCKNF